MANVLANVWQRIETAVMCKVVHCGDLGKSSPTNIWSQKSASIQPRTSAARFARSRGEASAGGPGRSAAHFRPRTAGAAPRGVGVRSGRPRGQQRRVRRCPARGSPRGVRGPAAPPCPRCRWGSVHTYVYSNSELTEFFLNVFYIFLPVFLTFSEAIS